MLKRRPRPAVEIARPLPNSARAITAMKRTRHAAKLGAAITVALVTLHGLALAQSGRSVMRGYVAFENVAWVDKQPTAKVTLRSITENNSNTYTGETSEHGMYEVPVPMGEYELTIGAPGFVSYKTTLYMPSDFIANLAVMLKKADAKGSMPKGTGRKPKA